MADVNDIFSPKVLSSFDPIFPFAEIFKILILNLSLF